ncbi:MAG: LptF/LptG family permease [Chlamydiia bacterium]
MIRPPLVWKLTLWCTLRTWALMVGAALALMIVLQMGEIARFAALAGEWQATLLFIALQVPYVLPNAIPLAALVASYWTFRRLSVDQELTAVRASGIQLHTLLLPLLCWGLCLGACNWGLSSEIAPQCRAEGKALLDRVAQLNPLSLIHLKRMLRLEDSWLNAEPEGRHAAHSLWCIAPMGPDGRLSVVHARRLHLQEGMIHGQGVLALTQKGEPGELWVEQSAHAELEAAGLAPFLLRSTLSRAEDYLSWSGQWHLACEGCMLAHHELVRRIALGLAPICFILLGAAYGMTTARQPRRRDLAMAMGLAFLTLASFLAGKAVPTHPWIFYPLFVVPPLLCVAFAWLRLRSLHEGRGC